MAAFGAGPLLLCTAGLVVLCLLKTPLRDREAIAPKRDKAIKLVRQFIFEGK